jgi:hypothetical protein
VLFERQILHLDRLKAQIRRNQGGRINRAEIIRALIDGLIDSRIDITQQASEASLRAALTRHLNPSILRP